jgi:hypothetical protein
VPAFDVRFLDPLMRKQHAGDGAYIDIRRHVSRTQRDTFYVRAQPANRSYPLSFSWPENLGSTFTSIFLKYQHGESSRELDMTRTTRLELGEDGPETIMIITSGVKGKLPWNK